MFHQLKQNHHDFMAFHLYYNEPLSHLIYAGSDLLLVPSMFEPCGLSQAHHAWCGTVPVVRRTGGLNDTVFDYDVDHKKAEWEGMKPNGFSFDGMDDGAIDFALDRAINLAYDKPKDFPRCRQTACPRTGAGTGRRSSTSRSITPRVSPTKPYRREVGWK